MQASLRRFSLPLREPLVTSSGAIERREGVLVRVESDGVSGVGEATPLPGWTESYESCVDVLEEATERLEVDGPESALSALSDTPAARHGLGLSLLDREARRTAQPLYRLLGTDVRVESVPANATIGDGDVAETVASARDATAAGFDCLKVKVGARPVDEDVERIAAVRDAAGPTVTLRADANGAWTRDQAREAFDALAEFDVEFVEQPVDPGGFDGLAGLRGGPVGVAVDETLATTDPTSVVDAGLADVLIVKPMVLGGLDRALDAVRLASEAGIASVVSTTVDAAVARAAATHLAASLEDPAPAGLATAGWLAEDVAADPAPVLEGRVNVPRGVGHGARIEGWSA